MLDRPVIRRDFEHKYLILLELLQEEIEAAKKIYDQHIEARHETEHVCGLGFRLGKMPYTDPLCHSTLLIWTHALPMSMEALYNDSPSISAYNYVELRFIIGVKMQPV
ncbi:unnamed protein product [Protopolystoma xenopodis]|uniref:Uncharacterized protein n=1 Tax=Protopolystoma xenopodis TaxID=117903 RepID=A0A448WN23_9PLAT|nr:unnamed protein product [Protopolystoma xenopodis]